MRKVLCPRSCPVIGAARCGPPAQFLASALGSPLASPLAQSLAHTTWRVSRHVTFPKLRFPVAASLPAPYFPCRCGPPSSLLPFLPLPPRRAAFRRPGGQAHGRDQTVSNSPRSTIRSPLSRDTPRARLLSACAPPLSLPSKPLRRRPSIAAPARRTTGIHRQQCKAYACDALANL